MSTQGLIFNIQKFSLHDGPGIRTTVFFKGCPLRCHWCHNLESQEFTPEVLLRGDLCTGCGACIPQCPQGAIALVEDRARTERERCLACGACRIHCPQNGRSVCGEPMSVEEIMTEVLKDVVFYQRSGGGVTFSGGEAMAQIGFLSEVLTACKKHGLHTAVDTSGCVPWSHFEKVIPLTDLFLYDLKLMDDALHRRYTGLSNQPILKNLQQLSRMNAEIWIRFLVIPGLTDQPDNLKLSIDFLREIRFRQIHLLPFHELGRGKAAQLDRPWGMPGIRPPSEESLETIRTAFTAADFTVVAGG